MCHCHIGPEFTSSRDSPHLAQEKAEGHVSEKKVVLVTGAAGFIGYHLSVALHQRADVVLVGVDLFVETYNPQLKLDRAAELHELGVQFLRGDVCDHAFLRYLFESYQFTHVVHLAACAGVRRSMDDPLPYLHHNVDCFLSLLQTVKDKQVHTRAHMCMHIHTHTHTSDVYKVTSVIHTHKHTYIHTYTHIYSYIHIYTHTYMFAGSHTYLLAVHNLHMPLLLHISHLSFVDQ